MKTRHIFNHVAAFGISRKAIFASAIAIAVFGIPALSVAGPSVGIGYSDVGLLGHAGRPGVTLSVGNLSRSNVSAWGSATYARGYYNVNASIGKLLPAGGVSFTPYASIGYLNLGSSEPESVSDTYGMAGVNLNIPIGQRVAILVGGGYGHTLSDGFGGAGGAVYKGKAELGMEVARHVTATINVSYMHIPGQQIMTEGAGLSYHFS
ncbi:hypothetical protein [Acidithiobacillus ferrooxidans]|uniref:hypothetical protein n=1 Tax=Acidithiobacillus ferrooxidans TaxID=920 RepID=UPI000AA7C5E3|nr:hypothetical protein [Acidithiobacillus ferrooxidans]